MLIQCEKCSTRYNLDEAKIPGKGAKVTCPTCKHVFIVMKGQGAAAPAGAPPAAAPAAPTGSTRTPTNPPGKSLLDNFFDDSKTIPGNPFGGAPAPSAPAANLGGPARGIRSWKVRVASGLVYDFTDVATLKAWIAEKKVTTADQISADGATWTVIGQIANLDAFFGGPSASPTPTPPPAPAPSGMGAPGPAPLTGFGPAPSGPAAPAFAAPVVPPPQPSGAGGSLADLFNSPAPGGNGADPFAGAPPSAANPFASPAAPPPAAATNPFGGPPPASANPFGAPPTPTPAPQPSPFGGADPFASAPPPAAPANPFGGPDPFASSAPPPPNGGSNPFGGADPFAAAPAPPAGGDPFAASGNPFGGAAPPPPMMGPKPAPPPWLSGPAPAVAPPAPAPPPAAANAPPPPPSFAPQPIATAKSNTSWSSAGDVTAKPAAIPTGKGGRKIGRTVGIAVAGIAVLGVAGGLFMNFERVQAMFRPVPTPEVTPTPPPIVLLLDGEARDHYVRGRRFLRLDTPDAYAKAEEEFRAALAKANGNPKAAAGVLEALALQKASGTAVDDAELASAREAAILALREDGRSVEANRALAQAAAAAGAPQDALPYLETALATRPDDAESLFLRGKLRSADPAQAAAAAEDLGKAASDATLTRAVMLKAEGAKPKSPEKKAADELTATNAAALAALQGGTWTWTPQEFAVLLPGVPVPTPQPAATATPAATETALATTATPGTTATAIAATPTPAPTATAIAATPTPGKTPVAVSSPVPTKTPIAAKTATPKPTRTPLAATTGEPTLDQTPAPTPVAENTQIATASAADHFVAAQALEQAQAYDDAIGEYQQAIKLAPRNSQYKLALAGAQMRGRKFQDAATTLADLIEVEPNNAGAHRLLGLLFDTTGQTSNACGEFSEYLRLKPQAADAGDIRTRMLRNGCE